MKTILIRCYQYRKPWWNWSYVHQLNTLLRGVPRVVWSIHRRRWPPERPRAPAVARRMPRGRSSSPSCLQTGASRSCSRSWWFEKNTYTHILVDGFNPSEKIWSQLELFPICRYIKNVPDHQPDIYARGFFQPPIQIHIGTHSCDNIETYNHSDKPYEKKIYTIYMLCDNSSISEP